MNRTLAIRFGRWLLFVGPAAGLFVLELLHPNPYAQATVYQSVSPVVDWWIQLHLLLFVLFALLAFAIFVSLAGEQGRSPRQRGCCWAPSWPAHAPLAERKASAWGW